MADGADVVNPLASVDLIVPTGHPARGGVRAATRADVDYALLRATRYLNAGGCREAVAEYVDEWLDYRSELDALAEIGRL